jgi:uncharacterized protein YjiK
MKNQIRKNIQWNFKGKKHFLFAPVSVLLGLILSLSFVGIPAASAQEGLPLIWQVQVLEPDQTGLSSPVGLAFSARANAFQVAEGNGLAETTDLVKLTPFAERAGEARIAAAVQNPINLAYDNQVGRLLILRDNGNQLWEVREGPDGNLDPQTLTRHNIRDLNVQDPQGMAVDANSTLFILDAAAPRLIRVQLGAAGDFGSATLSEVNLSLASPHGLAFDATSGNLHVMVPAEQKLYEVSQSGEVLNVRDLASFNFKNPQGMVFAPSGDQTDDPTQLNLYVADSGVVEEQPTGSQSTGQIVELSLVAPIEAAAANFSSSLIKTTNMAAISPPSPDPSGITYLPTSNTLVIVDGEVEETVNGITHFQGANVWELTLAGSKVRTANISTRAPAPAPMTNEPTGVTWNPSNGHYFVTDDNAKRVYNLNPGGDNLIGTADDTWTYFGTGGVGNGDPEGIAFDTLNNQLFVADGVNREVYQYSLTGALLNHFDVSVYGVQDPESVEFNPESGTLFVMSSNSATRVIVETTLDGTLLQTINISATQALAAAGLAYAPASDGSGVMRFYIVDRGIDNNNNPNIVDGKMYEMSAEPGPVTDLIFADSFESGNLSAWTASVTNSGNLNVSSGAALVGSFGLRATFNNNNPMYVRDDTPNAEPRYHARFYFDPNSISMVSGDSHVFFQSNMGTSTAVVRGAFRFSSGQYQVRFGLINDGGTWRNTAWVTISDASHPIEIDWAAATAAGANNGFLTLWIDGTQKASLTGTDNDTKWIDRVTLGPRSGIDSGTRGTYFLDAFESRRQTYIGP